MTEETGWFSAVGWYRGLHLTLNGQPITTTGMREYFAELDDQECDCAPGLGWTCPRHTRSWPVELDAPFRLITTIERL